MRKLIAFLRRFRVFLVFAVLQLIALGAYFSWSSYPRTKFLNSANTVVGTLYSLERDVSKYIALDDENRQLRNENALLSKKVPLNFLSVDPKTSRINDTIHELSFERIPATVINASYSHKNNYFTIDAGTAKGVKRKMGVISPLGAVGIVYDVSKHYAVVKSILTSTINISAFVENVDAFGLIKYEENNPRYVNLTGISNDINIVKGARVYTVGSAGFFPRGTKIGTIKDFEPIEGKPMWDIEVELQQDMRRLSHVYVIKNIFKQELDSLQNKIEVLQ